MLRTLIQTSSFVALIKILTKGYHFIESWLDSTYKNSQTHRIVIKVKDRLKVYFGYSLLGKITEIKQKDVLLILNESKVIWWLINLYRKWKQKIFFYLTISKTKCLAEQLQKDTYLLPIKTVSTILIVAIITNITFSILLKKEAGILNWTVTILLLFIGIIGLNSYVDWPTVKSNSLILRLIFKKKCAGSAEK